MNNIVLSTIIFILFVVIGVISYFYYIKECELEKKCDCPKSDCPECAKQECPKCPECPKQNCPECTSIENFHSNQKVCEMTNSLWYNDGGEFSKCDHNKFPDGSLKPVECHVK